MVAWVESNRPVIPLLAVAAGKPAYGFIYDNTQTFAFMRLRAQVTGEAFEENAAQDPLAPPTLSILLPHLSDLRMAARFLALDAREHMTRGEFADAWPSLDIAHRLGALLYSGQTIIEQLVGASVIATATNEMRNTLHQMGDRLTPQQLAAVKASHLMTMPIEAIKGNFQSEKDFFFNDVVQYVFTDDGNGNGHLIPSQFAKVTAYGGAPSDGPSGFMDDASLLAMAAVHADRKDTIEKYHDLWDQMEERYSLPLYDPRRTEVDQVVETIRNDPSSGQRFALIHVLLPSLSRAHQLVREATMNELATRAIVAVLQYRADHGALPQRLGELTPNYLASLPTDEYSGMNLRYVVDGVDFKLYSVGDNLKDDGGLGEKVRDGNGKGRTGPADIVYWPPPND